jgi:hypothetical protein
VDFFKTYTTGDMRLLGLISEAKQARSIIIHVHGYGGDSFLTPLFASV